MNILIVGTYRPVHYPLLAAGHSLWLVIERGQTKPKDLKTDYRGVFIYRPEDVSAGHLEPLAEALHKAHRFDWICCFQDREQALACRIASRLGVRHVLNEAALPQVIDKARTRASCQAAGLPSIGFQKVEDERALLAAVEALAPVIVKPPDQTASEGVHYLADRNAAESAIRDQRLAADAYPLLVEEFLAGPEYSVECLSEAGRHHLLGITEKFKYRDSFIERGHLFPARLTAQQVSRVSGYVGQVLDAVGIRTGPSHTEIILTAEGPRLVETHTRLGGDAIPNLIECAMGLELFDIVGRQGVGERVAERLADLTVNRYAASWFPLPHQRTGRVRRITLHPTLPPTVTLQSRELFWQAGQDINGLHSSADRAAQATLSSSDPDALLTACEALDGGLVVDFD